MTRNHFVKNRVSLVPGLGIFSNRCLNPGGKLKLLQKDDARNIPALLRFKTNEKSSHGDKVK